MSPLLLLLSLAVPWAAAAPARPLTAAERSAAVAPLGRDFSPDAEQSFRVTLAPVGEVDVLTGDQAGTPSVAVVTGDRVLQRLPIDPTPGRVSWGGIMGVMFVDLDKDGADDILAMADVCAGMDCQKNAYVSVLALIQRQGSFLPARAWASAIPYDVVKAGLGSVRSYAKARPARLEPDEQGKGPAR